MSKFNHKVWIWVSLIGVVTACVMGFLLLKDQKGEKAESHDHEVESETQGHDNEKKPEVEEKEWTMILTPTEAVQQGIKFAQVEQGEVSTSSLYPAKIIQNPNQQAHVSSGFSGRVENVNVALGEEVKKGQVLAWVSSPELVDQQSNLSMAEENLKLFQQDYQREKQLFQQGISAQQDYLKAFNAYKRSQIEVQALRRKLATLGVNASSNGLYAIKSPIYGVVSKKDLLVGEHVQTTDQVMVIDDNRHLWLEFVLPSHFSQTLSELSAVTFESIQTQKTYQANIKTILPEADEQTGQIKVQADITSPDQILKPNMMVNVRLTKNSSSNVNRILKAAVQKIDGKNIVFTMNEKQGKLVIQPKEVKLGLGTEQTWVEVIDGLDINQRYVSEGSFTLKSDMEKGEADHGH